MYDFVIDDIRRVRIPFLLACFKRKMLQKAKTSNEIPKSYIFLQNQEVILDKLSSK
jgi:hypothetical protein